MLSVGKVLRGARLAQQLDLPTVSVRTKISVRYLEAIEADDRRSLPSGFFYKSFVDQYARFLGLDAPEINAEVDRLLSADAPLPLPGYESVVSRNVPRMKPSRSFPSARVGASLAVLIAVVVGCSGIYAWWHQGKLEKSGPSTAHAVASSPKTASTERTALPEEPATAAVAPGYKVLLDLMAHEETWLSITSEGKRLFSGVLAANQTKTVEGKESATMKVGNAAGLEVRLNGKLLGPLGGRGQVLVVVFTPDKFQIVPPMPREGD
jgi:cytoskeletal protein RodZ